MTYVLPVSSSSESGSVKGLPVLLQGLIQAPVFVRPLHIVDLPRFSSDLRRRNWQGPAPSVCMLPNRSSGCDDLFDFEQAPCSALLE